MNFFHFYLEQINNLKFLNQVLFLPSTNNKKIYTAAGMV